MSILAVALRFMCSCLQPLLRSKVLRLSLYTPECPRELAAAAADQQDAV